MRHPTRLPKPVTEWFDAASAEVMFVSVPTLLEIEVGMRRLERRDPRQGAISAPLEKRVLAPAFNRRILAIDEEIAGCCGGLQVPDPRPLLDALIAGTAIVRKLRLVTRNVADFCAVPLFNPWDK